MHVLGAPLLGWTKGRGRNKNGVGVVGRPMGDLPGPASKVLFWLALVRPQSFRVLFLVDMLRFDHESVRDDSSLVLERQHAVPATKVWAFSCLVSTCFLPSYGTAFIERRSPIHCACFTWTCENFYAEWAHFLALQKALTPSWTATRKILPNGN